jgi:hypothetical protein
MVDRQALWNYPQDEGTRPGAELYHAMGPEPRADRPLDQASSHGPVRHLSLYIASELHEHVEKAAASAGMKTAPWLRHMVRQITMTDFPPSWQEATPRQRSHDSRTVTERFMLRLDHTSSIKLQSLRERFDVPKAHIIRQLIAQATLEDFPKCWQLRAAERRVQQSRH